MSTFSGVWDNGASCPEYQRAAILANIDEYGEKTHRQLKWLDNSGKKHAEMTRAALLAELFGLVQPGYLGTKLDCNNLSAGCRACGDGQWSCLFINGKCNCRCFYCPTEQNRIGVPTTQRVQFPRADAYADYVEKFQFRGVGISGGEPLLSFDTSLKYIAAVRKRLKDQAHIWLYTNGTLSNPTLLARLRDAGLDEIRFDIGATGYRLEKVRQAVGIIPVVTVEIPAIPEDYPLLKELAGQMADAGISHLNLHQLRLTPHNLENLRNRPYTFLHGEKVTVLESELAALRLLKHCFEAGIHLPINYCSFHYKRSFQQAAVRKKCAPFVIKPHENLTGKGFIRSLYLTGNAGALAKQAHCFSALDDAAGKFVLSGNRLYLSASLTDAVSNPELKTRLLYFEPRLLSSVSYRHAFASVPLNRRAKVIVEKTKVCDEIEPKPEDLEWFRRQGAHPNGGFIDAGHPSNERLLFYETIRPGFPAYY